MAMNVMRQNYWYHRFLSIILLLFCIYTPNTIHAVQIPQARLISEMRTIQPGTPFWVAVHLPLAAPSYTYWRNPGDKGLATELHWDLPSGFTVSEIHWLAPQIISKGTIHNFGYEGHAYHLAVITPPVLLSPQSIQLKVVAEWLICNEMCMPHSVPLTLEVNVGHTIPEPSAEHSLIHSLINKLPPALPNNLTYLVNSTEVRLDLSFLKETPKTAVFMPYEEGILKTTPQLLEKSKDDLTLKIEYMKAPPTQVLQGLLQVTFQDGSLQTWQVAAQAMEPSAPQPQTLWHIVLFAFLGGLLLNIMPCVFPILSLKALNFARYTLPAQARQEGFLYTCGVLISFSVLAIILLILKQGGTSLGWGFQMQTPFFVGIIIYLLFTIGLSLSGVFDLPGLYAGTSSHASSPKWSHFLGGVLAVLIATPCTGPFMGVAIGYSLGQSPLITFGIFLALGIGFSLPYLALSLVPSLGRFLPTPGSWMVTFKEALAFPLYGSVIWLGWVLIQQTGSQGFLWSGLGMLILIFNGWLWPKLALKSSLSKVFIFLLMSMVTLFPLTQLHPKVIADSAIAHKNQEDFNYKKIAHLRERQIPFLLNITAAWCITCQFNEIALKSPAVQELMTKKGIVYIEADWTSSDKEITALLQEFERQGVPLYVLYPASGSPQVLPALLTENMLLEALNALNTLPLPPSSV